MSSKAPSDDTSKPGFVSAIVMKFTNLAQTSLERSPDEKRLHLKHQQQREIKRDIGKNIDISSRGKLFEQPKDTSLSGESLGLKSTSSIQSKPCHSQDTVKTTIDNRINAEYQVIGEVNVKDRIKAFSALQETVKMAVNRPEVLKSTKYVSPRQSSSLGNVATKKVLSRSAYEENIRNATAQNESSKPSVVPKKRISELISQLHKAASVDVDESMSKAPFSRSISLDKDKISTSISKKPISSDSAKNKAGVSSSTQIEPESSSTDSSEVYDPTKASSGEYFFDVGRNVQTELAVPQDDYTMDSSMIDEIMAQDDDDDDSDIATHADEHLSRLSSVTSKECLHVDHSNEKRNFILYEPAKTPNYTPWPKSYSPVVDEKGCLTITLPDCHQPSMLKKSNGTKTPKKLIKFNTDKLTVMETYSVYEYERGDDSIDPLTASAEYEIEKKTEELDKFEVVINKDEKGLGMSIVGIGLGSDVGSEKLGIYIKLLTPGGASERLRVHDQLLEVDGISLVGVTQSFAAQTLKSTSKTVKFLIGREKNSASLSS